MEFREVESTSDFIANSFPDGRAIRELRLTNDELAYVKEVYPQAQIERLSDEHVPQNKEWYRININPLVAKQEVVKT